MRSASSASSIEQTTPLARNKVRVPVVTLGGEKALGAHVGEMVALVADNIEAHVIADCGHFPQERPQDIIRHVLNLAAKIGT